MGRADLSPGLRIGRYELIQRLAVGGMAEIYLARATGIEGFEKLVVLKRILPQYANSREFVTMFLDEARLSATLQHPNIAQVYDIGQFEDSYFFTMEFIRGEDVRTILKAAVAERKRVPLANALTIIAGAAAGLHAAHEKRTIDGEPLNIVHRDVSPSNVLVSYDGGVKLVDFGVAKAAQRQSKTQAGTLKGKVSYMSPEQCRGKPLDRRSDIFALGILLFEMTTHRRLFKGESEFDIMMKIVNEDVPPPSKTFPKYPPALEKILMRALARDRENRYSSAQEMQVDLEEFARAHGLGLSAVSLGQYMRETFVERMRQQDAAVRAVPRTGEVMLEVIAGGAGGADLGDEEDDEELLEVEIEAAEPGDPANDDLAIDVEGPDLSALAPQPTVLSRPVSRASTEALAAAEVSRPYELQRSRRWPAALFGAAVAAAAVFFFTRGSAQAPTGAVPPSHAAAGVAHAVAPAPAPVPAPAAAAPAPTPAPIAGADPAPSEPADDSAATAAATDPETAPAAAESATRTAARKDSSSSAGEKPAKKAHERAHVRRASHRSKHSSPARRSKPPAAPPPPTKPKPKRDWGLDSPLPPPGRSR